jgi:hypothetical protein
MVFQAVRTGPRQLELREAKTSPEVWYLATKGEEAGVIRVDVVDLVFSEVTNADPSLPLLYLWEIQRDGLPFFRYVGKATDASRPRTHYRRNVRRLLTGQPYRKGSPDGFRQVHRQLARASQMGLPITLTLLRNVTAPEDIFEVERKAQSEWLVENHLGFDTP